MGTDEKATQPEETTPIEDGEVADEVPADAPQDAGEAPQEAGEAPQEAAGVTDNEAGPWEPPASPLPPTYYTQDGVPVFDAVAGRIQARLAAEELHEGSTDARTEAARYEQLKEAGKDRLAALRREMGQER